MLSESTPREWQQVPHNPQLLRRFVFDPQPFRSSHVRRRVLVKVSFTPYLRRRMGEEPGRLDSLYHTSQRRLERAGSKRILLTFFRICFLVVSLQVYCFGRVGWIRRVSPAHIRQRRVADLDRARVLAGRRSTLVLMLYRHQSCLQVFDLLLQRFHSPGMRYVNAASSLSFGRPDLRFHQEGTGFPRSPTSSTRRLFLVQTSDFHPPACVLCVSREATITNRVYLRMRLYFSSGPIDKRTDSRTGSRGFSGLICMITAGDW